MNEGTTLSRPGSARTLGIITNDPTTELVAERLTAIGLQTLYMALPPAPLPSYKSPLLEIVSSVTDIARACNTVAIAIDDMEQLRTILLGNGDHRGLVAQFPTKATLIDLGMRPPRELQSILDFVERSGIDVVDAAILGPADALRQGTANVLVGGCPDAVKAVLPVLCELGRVEQTGPLGSAQTAAALMGYVEEAHFTAQTEAVHFGQQLGITASSLSRIFNESAEEANIIRFPKRAEFAQRLPQPHDRDSNPIGLQRRLARVPPTESR